jgi:DNA polymerase V
MSRGGVRAGSGRPKGWGKYKEPTKAIRLPISVIPNVDKLINQSFELPLYHSKVSAGFPSPAEDSISENLNLNEYLIKHPAATFLVRAIGDSMINAGIHENDILVVDRSIVPSDGRIVIAAIDGQLTVKRLHKKNKGKYVLIPENPRYQPIEILEGNDTLIWGVVTQVIHSV